MPIRFLDPRNVGQRQRLPMTPRLQGLEGKVIGIRRNVWGSMQTLGEALEPVLRRDYRVKGIVWAGEPGRNSLSEEEMNAFTGKIDAALIGLATGGAGTSTSVHDLIEVEKRGVPGVLIVTTVFQLLAELTLQACSYPDLRMVVLPHPLDNLSSQEIGDIARARAADIVSALVQSM